MCIADFGPLWTGLLFCWFHLICIYVGFVGITSRILVEVSSDTLRPLYSLYTTTNPPPRGAAGHGLLILEVSRSHNDASQSVGFLWTSDQLVAETSTWQHTQQTNIHAPRGIRTHNLSRRTAADLCFGLRSHWDRYIPLLYCVKMRFHSLL